MFCHLGAVRRLCLEKILLQWVLQTRSLSGAEAVNALRPFYFAVHPDFFGQHPREREINENSLKRLNGYLENLQKPGFKSFKPTQLTFYVREREQNSSDVQESFSAAGFRAVSFTLHTRDLLSTVLDILNSCSLSTEHVQSVNSQPHKEVKGTFYRPIKWDKTYYSFTGFKDPEEELEQAQRVEITLISWLDNSEKSAIKKLRKSLPLREELNRLKDELTHQLQLSDIRWQRSWGIAHRCSQLHSLGRLAQQSPEVLRNVKEGLLELREICGSLLHPCHQYPRRMINSNRCPRQDKSTSTRTRYWVHLWSLLPWKRVSWCSNYNLSLGTRR
uniref:T cell activation inhibitor, mitochondrial n=1 Tax=Terrapene triunguis TaxID=2587831 RepID=A0A674KE65_9SAUR